jgi:hypothetical protein
MTWYGGNCEQDKAFCAGGSINPYAVDRHEKAVAYEFTTVPETASLALSFVQRGWQQTDATRGNLGISRQDARPMDWLNKPQYLAFTSLRAYPVQQMRKLCIALREGNLPLAHPDVHRLIRQSLYHLGEIAFDATGIPSFAWKLGQFGGGGGLKQLELELRLLSDQIAEKPRDHAALSILAEMSSYVSQWQPSCREVSRQLSATAYR